MLGILETQLIRYLADRFGGNEQLFFGKADDFMLYPFQSRLTGFFLNQVTEIVG